MVQSITFFIFFWLACRDLLVILIKQVHTGFWTMRHLPTLLSQLSRRLGLY